MNKLFATSLATALTTTLAFASVTPSTAASIQFSFGQRDQVVSRYCERNPYDRDCREYRSNHHDWSNDDYDHFYGRHRSGLDNLASGFFGFTFGTLLGSGIANSNTIDLRDRNMSRTHVARCEARFRSYDQRTDTYLGFDGDRHFCDL